MKYKVNEIFKSIQGEGFHTGTAMTFVRLAGCNLDCIFCDTNHEEIYQVPPAELYAQIKKMGLKNVCITGGEPFQQDLTPLLRKLVQGKFNVHIETNGTLFSKETRSAEWSRIWITCSPKLPAHLERALKWADEIKILISERNNVILDKLLSLPEPGGIVKNNIYLQPIWVVDTFSNELNTKRAVKYVMDNPNLKLGSQMHKYLGIQ